MSSTSALVTSSITTQNQKNKGPLLQQPACGLLGPKVKTEVINAHCAFNFSAKTFDLMWSLDSNRYPDSNSARTINFAFPSNANHTTARNAQPTNTFCRNRLL